MSQTAKLFSNGRSQAVRLPAAYRFDTKEVFIRKDPETGDIILSRKPETWSDFFDAIKDLDVPVDFLDVDERRQDVCDRDPFDEGKP
ncbi:AbrB/MazE/SpoVT family DNA-binding domain-containing protein [Pollutimonas subterranea]|uniref:AbrB/MazE/SpoVT family DNA-binding domain-containing protein n=1 Tax=Pollutimonas subterranea TaxID=2045210 RepID=A0A2N4TZE4_9BURK|nr:AbrB/MazE/SpoVT family DNA-binding domain-containing protein [Pollutimonas subterranea]PLC48135.1 AbrB/MazE/SpoVT family DNA-binding domain-containing protein [Pollutimonas subterranea]